MARVKRAVNAQKKRRAILEQASGYRGQRSRLYRKAKEQVTHSLVYNYNDRKKRKGDFRQLWIQRINAAARANGITYNRFIQGLKAANVEVDRKILAELAVNDANAFATLVEVAQKALPSDVNAPKAAGDAALHRPDRRGRAGCLAPPSGPRCADATPASRAGPDATRPSRRVRASARGPLPGRGSPQAGAARLRGERRRDGPRAATVREPRPRSCTPTPRRAERHAELLAPRDRRPGPRGAPSPDPRGGRRDLRHRHPAGPGRPSAGSWTAVRRGAGRAARPRLVAVLAHVRDPGNAGTVLRCADAAGADAVVLTDASVDPYNPKAVRASPAACSTCRSPSACPSREAVRGCGPRACGCWPPTAAGDRDLDEELDARPDGRRRPPGCSATRRGACPRRPGRWPTRWCGCRSTAGRRAEPRHGRGGVPVRLRAGAARAREGAAASRPASRVAARGALRGGWRRGRDAQNGARGARWGGRPPGGQ